MRIRKLAPSGRVEGRWLCHLEDGTILRLGESEVVAFGLGTGKELSGAELSALTEAARAAQVRAHFSANAAGSSSISSMVSTSGIPSAPVPVVTIGAPL